MTGALPIWLDCDPGHDDVFAILLACASPWFDLVGISTVHGNSSLAHTTYNALAVLTAFGKTHIKVYPGADKPMTGECHLPESIHGASGLDGTSLLPVPTMSAQPEHSAVKAMRDAIDKFDGELALVATGSLTNIAELFQSCTNEQLHKIRYLSLMGGAINCGNWTPYAEFNIWADITASNIVFSSPIMVPKTIIAPLNITHQALATPKIAEKIRYGDPANPQPSDVRQMLYELILFFTETYKKQFEFNKGPPLHDPLAVYVLLYFLAQQKTLRDNSVPDIKLQFERAKINVVQDGDHIGETVPKEDPHGTYIAYGADLDLFWKTVLESLDRVANNVGC